MIWLKHMLNQFEVVQGKYVLYCDSQSAIYLAKNAAFHSRTKHIDVWYQFIRLALERGYLHVEKIHTNDSLVDLLTKVVSAEKTSHCRRLFGLAET